MIASTQVYDELRARIMRGELKPGAALKERDLCAQLDVSRTPVREALRQLSAEGLVEVRPHRSIVVASFDPAEVEEVFELGVMLESFIAGLAAEKATDDDRRQLRAIVDAMAVAAADSADVRLRYAALDRDFHEALAAAARSPRVAAVLRQTVNFRLLIDLFRDYEPLDIETSLMQHRNILAAVDSANADWASAAMRNHIRTGQGIRRKIG